ncbi:MAG: polysaccharide biosynthesis C-terminal domain-containing protein [Flavobacteriales bacterium]|nr:polysaccharide biosynthesis C-terminal domain-containing protein [Flavobacteriales bacterium]
MGEIRKQSIINSVFSYLGIALGFVYLILLLPAALGKEELGLTRFILSVATLLGTLFPAGLNSFVLRFFPRFRDPSSGHHGFIRLVALMAIGGFVLMCLLLWLLRAPLAHWYSGSALLLEYGYLVIPMSFAIGMFTVINAYTMSLFRSSMGVFLNDVFIRILLVAIALLHLNGMISFRWFLFASVSAYVLLFVVLLVYVMLIDKGMWSKIDWTFIRKSEPRTFFTYLLYIAPASVASMALRQIDTAMLGSNLSAGEAMEGVAVFSLAYTLSVIIDTPAGALSRITDAKIADAIHRKDHDFTARVYSSSVRLLTVIGGILLVGVVINLPNLWQIMADDYSTGTFVVYVLGFSAFINMATGVNGSLLSLSEHFRKVSVLLLGLILFSVVLNAILIPIYGIRGAAIASATAMIAYNIAKSWIVWREFGVQPIGRPLFITILLCAVVLGLNQWLPVLENPYFDTMYRSAIILLIYAFSCKWLGLIPEWDELRHTLRQRWARMKTR